MTVGDFKKWMSDNGITDNDELMIDGCNCKHYGFGKGRFLSPLLQEYLKAEQHPLDHDKKLITMNSVYGYRP